MWLAAGHHILWAATVTLEALGNVGEFLGGIVVVVSLFYLAFQVRQNTQSLRTESYARALERVSAIQNRLAGDPDLSAVIGRGIFDADSLTREERIRFTWLFYEMFGAFEFMFLQAQKGVLEDEVWRRWSATMSWWLSLPGVSSWWHSKPTPFSASFSSLVDSLMDTDVADAASAQRFTEFLQGNAS